MRIRVGAAENRVEQMRRGDDVRPVSRDGAFDGNETCLGEANDVRGWNAGQLAPDHLQRDLADDRNSFGRPHADARG
jgi:hypothetical protein